MVMMQMLYLLVLGGGLPGKEEVHGREDVLATTCTHTANA
jgi:hypothetical protein